VSVYCYFADITNFARLIILKLRGKKSSAKISDIYFEFSKTALIKSTNKGCGLITVL
jgi:hypothetical protein